MQRSTGLVSVERSQFGLWEDDPLGESDVHWLQLPMSAESPGVTVGHGAVGVLSSAQHHYARVTLERSGAAVPPEGYRPLARVPYRSRSGRVEAWTLFSGPAGVTLDLGAEDEDFVLHVFWAADPARLGPGAGFGVPEDAERFHFVFVPDAD
ncbi:hypothetical protein [Kitasatospora sp. NBC_00458]|uniref:hypothetical protein n=1 Tax=Kitasatospora sp. NBC_00458 TaxID=2903568 RepID=UPI002E19ED7C